MRPVLQVDAGSTPYAAAYRWQQDLHRRRVADAVPDVLLLVEHPAVFTLGRRFRPSHLLADGQQLERLGIEVFEADRGGSITYHGPGQLVAYPVVDLRTPDGGVPDAIRYLRTLEAATLATVVDFGIPAGLRPGLTGVWVGTDKLASIGINVSRGVTRHGVAINVSVDLKPFGLMVPCGIPGAGVTSMESLLRGPVALNDVARCFAGHLSGLLGRRLVKADAADLGLSREWAVPSIAGTGTCG